MGYWPVGWRKRITQSTVSIQINENEEARTEKNTWYERRKKKDAKFNSHLFTNRIVIRELKFAYSLKCYRFHDKLWTYSSCSSVMFQFVELEFVWSYLQIYLEDRTFFQCRETLSLPNIGHITWKMFILWND